MERYDRHLRATLSWLERSCRPQGGSAAYWMPARGWSRSYPETTGYLIDTLLRAGARTGTPQYQRAVALGEWLLGIQSAHGWWHAGLHPPRGEPRPSVFNTAQVLDGLAALHCRTGEERWRAALERGSSWLAACVDPAGDWDQHDYRSASTPTYYTQAAWQLLQAGSLLDDAAIRDAAHRVLARLVDRRRVDGAFECWGFESGRPAFTHTIAYTLRGLLEGAQLLDAWDELGAPAVPALEHLAHEAELTGGRLPGAYRGGWERTGGYVCLTGNAQLAICLLLLERRDPDLRLVNAAAKLVDVVCGSQFMRSRPQGLGGAVAGSLPPWGAYISLRFPNWAAKYHADALMALTDRLGSEPR